jgi:hypothetical protein
MDKGVQSIETESSPHKESTQYRVYEYRVHSLNTESRWMRGPRYTASTLWIQYPHYGYSIHTMDTESTVWIQSPQYGYRVHTLIPSPHNGYRVHTMGTKSTVCIQRTQWKHARFTI